MKMDTSIFREYDIRGVYNRDFDLLFARELGAAFVRFLKIHERTKSNSSPFSPLVTLGYDARISSPEICAALEEGIRKMGGRVVLLGMITTPISYFSTFTIDGASGAIMVTGSHNPPEYNGFKLSAGKGTIFGSDIKKLETLILEDRGQSTKGKILGSSENFDILPSYVARYKEEFGDLGSTAVVLDCGNGAAGVIVRRMYEACGLAPHILFEKPDGRFPNHHPDPTVEENLKDLKTEVQKRNAKVGIGFDGDADRIGVLDENGKMIFGDELIALYSQSILLSHPGATIIGDVKCSNRMYDFIERRGGHPIMWKTGHSLIKQKVKDEKSPFGGELSGHVFFADRNYGYDDAPYAGLRLIEILAKSGKTIGELLKDLPKAYCTPEIRIDTTEEKKFMIVEHLVKAFSQDRGAKVDLIDGIRVSYSNGWALARASNTQPVLVLRFESETQSGLDEIRSRFEAVIQPLL